MFLAASSCSSKVVLAGIESLAVNWFEPPPSMKLVFSSGTNEKV